MHSIDLKKYNIRTDMVVDILDDKSDFKYETYKKHGVIVSWMKLDKINVFNKKEGNYITIEFSDITDTNKRKKLEKILTEELMKMLNIIKYKSNYKTMVVGLGNNKSTPDSLGPLVTEKIIVTNHLYTLGIDVDKKLSRSVSISPGVMASTGIETSDYINALVKKIKPDLLIVVDSLASSSVSRLNKSIQITDSGISPGSGVGNNRKEISKDTLNIPVIAIGVPTVVEATTIIYDTLKYMIDDNKKLDNIIDKSLSKNLNLMVTPKEIDFVIDKLSDVISYAINHSIHKLFK